MLLFTDALATPWICKALELGLKRFAHMIVCSRVLHCRISATIYTIYPYSACVRSHTYQEPTVWIYLCSASVFHIRAAFSVLSLGSTWFPGLLLRFSVPAAVFCKKSLTCALLPMTTSNSVWLLHKSELPGQRPSNDIFLFFLENVND